MTPMHRNEDPLNIARAGSASQPSLTRRGILASAFTAAATGLLPAASVRTIASSAAVSAAVREQNPLCVFTKPFNSLTAEQMAERCHTLGFQGLEAPMRRGGHIEPEAVADELPAFIEGLQKHNQQLLVMTSDINDPNDVLSRKCLETAASLGVRYYRLKYFRYDESRPVLQQISEWRRQLEDLAVLNRELGITGVYQNHAGRGYFGAAIWDLQRALEQTDPQHLGMAFDIRHATAEAGMNWPVNFLMIQPHVQVVYVKDFQWGTERQPENVPLGHGRVDSAFFELLRKVEFRGPISLHEEYLDHRKPELVPDHWAAIEKDLQVLQQWLG